jgi:hypothetical protein
MAMLDVGLLRRWTAAPNENIVVSGQRCEVVEEFSLFGSTSI